MTISLYVGAKKATFNFGIGWYKGEPFNLLNIQLLEIQDITPKYTMVTLFNIQIAKFAVYVGMDLKQEFS